MDIRHRTPFPSVMIPIYGRGLVCDDLVVLGIGGNAYYVPLELEGMLTLYIRQPFGSSFLSYHWRPSPWLLRNLLWRACHTWMKRLVSIMHFSALVSSWGPPRVYPWSPKNALGTILGASHGCTRGEPQISKTSRCISRVRPWATPPTRWELPRAFAHGWLRPLLGSLHRRSPVEVRGCISILLKVLCLGVEISYSICLACFFTGVIIMLTCLFV